jgi:hypothetical protein
MNLEGITIDNNGVTMTPCIETRCDSHYVYIASNGLPHYDFVQTTPNALTEVTFIYRLPYTATPVGTNASATNAADVTSCTSAYTAYVDSSPTTSEPSGLCGNNGYLYDSLANGTKSYFHKIPCLNTTGLMISGPPVFGPNEAQVPDPWGNPAYYWPATAGESYVPANHMDGAPLDLCGGHTGNSMHYHAVNEACFARDADGAPENSYVAATENWSFSDLVGGSCTTESGIVGWSADGYPIRGPCVCTARNGDGSCATVKRARSSWVYGGLSTWSGGSPSPILAKEGQSCSQTSDCCPDGGTCKFKCSFAVFPDASAPGGTVSDQRCVLLDYSWCANQYVDRTTQDVSATNFVYMDRCNGYQGPDGYSYYATGSFPFMTGCYHGVPTDSSGGGQVGGMMMPGGGMMNGPPDGGLLPTCPPGQTTMCCGDGICEGPETPQNCPEDCQ